jgi:hypothetical protein
MKRQYERLREGLRDNKRQEREMLDYLAGKGGRNQVERGRGRGDRWGIYGSPLVMITYPGSPCRGVLPVLYTNSILG